MAEKTAVSTLGDRVLESLKTGQTSALEAVHKFVATVNSALPDIGGEDAPRKKVIDSAFKMTEQLVGVATEAARNIMKAGQEAVEELEVKGEAKKAS